MYRVYILYYIFTDDKDKDLYFRLKKNVTTQVAPIILRQPELLRKVKDINH